MSRIQSLHGREILDSRGNPTIAVRVTLEDGTTAEAMVPSGASTGTHEAMELRDNDNNRFNGKGVLTARDNINNIIAKELIGLSVLEQRTIDGIMIDLDGTDNKERLGANAILGVSLAVAQAAALFQKIPLYISIRNTYKITKPMSLPYPMMNIVNGGKHANNKLTFQEFMVVPQQETFRERLRCGAEIFAALKVLLNEKGEMTGVGDEGGFAPDLEKNEEAFALIAEAITHTQYTLGKEVQLAIDPAVSEYVAAHEPETTYTFDDQTVSAQFLIDQYATWREQYHLTSVEDGLAEDAWKDWSTLTQQLGATTQLVGDDLFVTREERLQKGIDEGVANAILIKPNQIGTLTETIDTIELAQRNGYRVVISHRSGETEDTTIADLAVAVGAEHIKTGSLSRSERIAKYNRLLAIEEELENTI